jgi:phage repressor protein C with HTH and peptisase S24 domain
MNLKEMLGKPTESIPFPAMYLSASSAQTFLLGATGKNMEPRIKDGDLLFCTLNSDTKSGDVVILYNGENFHCKFQGRREQGMFFYDAHMNVFEKPGYKVIAKVSSVYSRKV